MNDRDQDTELRARFDAQRRADASGSPSFDAMIKRARADAANVAPIAPHRITQRRLVVAGGLAAAAVLAFLLMVPRATSNEDAFERAVRAYESGPASGAWQSPTDGLLDVPGNQLITTVPSVGVN